MSSGDGLPTSYEDIYNVMCMLPVLVEEKRRRERLSLRAAASDSGVSDNVIMRFEKNENVEFRNALALLAWVGGFR